MEIKCSPSLNWTLFYFGQETLYNLELNDSLFEIQGRNQNPQDCQTRWFLSSWRAAQNRKALPIFQVKILLFARQNWALLHLLQFCPLLQRAFTHSTCQSIMYPNKRLLFMRVALQLNGIIMLHFRAYRSFGTNLLRHLITSNWDRTTCSYPARLKQNFRNPNVNYNWFHRRKLLSVFSWRYRFAFSERYHQSNCRRWNFGSWFFCTISPPDKFLIKLRNHWNFWSQRKAAREASVYSASSAV